jgi:hypothetical protein
MKAADGLAPFCGPCRGVAKLVKAPDFDSGMRGFESFLPCQMSRRHPVEDWPCGHFLADATLGHPTTC